MSNETYRLQIRSHKEVFETREDAVRYMEDNFRHIALFGEPALFFYGDEKNPSMILAFGSTVNRKLSLCTIDDTELRELIAAVSEKADQSAADIEKLGARIISTINAAGLVLDENKIANQVSYEPGNSDALIKNAASIAEAVGIISQFVQKHVEDTELTVEDSKSVKLIYNKVEGEGATLKAKVLISGDGDTDEEDFNNNIIGVKKDGIFASANIEYDEDRHRLIFTTSGFDKNGKFKDDANKKVIDFGEHTEYTANNEDHDVKVTIDQDTHKISADVKISTDEDNGLVVKDGRLYVSMRAKDIKYKSSTVAKALNDLNDEIASIKEKIVILEGDSFIKGEETDTMVTTATHERNGGYTVKGDVRLSGNSSIIVKEGGLAVNIDVAVDKTTNKLTLTVGNETKVVELPGIDIISDMYYDGSNKALVIKTSDGKTITIPVGDMLTTWIVNNPANSPIVLTKATGASGTPDELSADLKLASSDNILKVDASGNLTAPKSEITNAVSVETDRATAAEQALSARIDEANDNIGENRTAIANEKAARELSESEIKADIETEVARAKAAEQALDAKIVVVEDNFDELKDTVNEKIVVVDGIDTRLTQAEDAIVANTTAIETESGRAREAEADIKADVTANAQNIETEKTRAQGVETQLASGIANTNTAITGEVTRAQGAEENLKTRMSEAERKLIVIQGGENTEGSITAIAKHYADDVKAALDNEVTRAKEAEDAIRETVADNKAEATQAAADALADAKHYTDDQITNLSTTVNAKFVSEKAEITEAYKAYADNGDTTVKSEAKAYTDEKVEAEKARAIAAETANTEAITAIQTKDGEQDTEIAKKIEKVEIVKNSDLQYFLVVDGVNVSEIDIPKDQFLKSVTYDSSNKKLHFVFVTSDGEVATDIDISDLIDTYTAGNGLTLANGEFAVRVNEDTEPYLFVSEEGITIRGIDAALALKADKADLADYYTKTEADAKFLTEHQDISGLATKDEVAAVDAKADAIEARVAANEGKLDVLNGNESTAGSVKKALADAKAYTDEKVSAEAATARTAEQANADAIAVINGNEAQEGSIKKAVKDAEAYADAAVAAEKTAREQSEADIMDAVDTKANAADVYTKAEIDAKNFLVGSDIANLATKAELAEETTRATTAETKNADDIAALAAVVDTKVGQVSIAKSPDNDLVYILKVDGEEAGRVNVPKDQFLKDVTYNSTTKILKFTFVTTDDDSKEVEINVSDLVDTYAAGNGLTLADNVFSVKIDEHSEAYLKLTEAGLELTGIDAALALKADKAYVDAQDNTITETVSAETARATAAETANAEAITGLTGSLSAEVARATAKEDAIEAKADANTAAIAVLNGNDTESGSVREIAKHVADDAAAALAAETERAKTAETANANAIAALSTSTGTGIADALAQAKAYTDAETVRATAAETANADAIAAANTEIAKKVEKVELKQSEDNPLVYTLFVDGSEKGKVNIPKDQFLKNVVYDADTKSLKFTFVTTDDDSKEVTVSIADLVDTYTAGNGLALANNQFSVTVDPSTQSYIEVTEYGVKVKGIDEALAAKANAADVYTKEAADAKFLTEHQSLADYALKSEVQTVSEGLTAVKTTADTAAADIAVINGNEAEAGSILNAIKQSKEYTDNAVATEKTARETADAAHTAAIAEKANAADVYTKAEIDAAGFADATEVASTYATKSEVATLETGVNAELAKKVENVALEQGDTNLIYKLMVDGVVKGIINIPKDQFLKDASYDAGNKNLVFVFQTEGEDKTVNVNVADLVDTYTAGNGLKVENNQFSVVINEDSETYLQLTPEGLKVVGIDAALAAKANAADVYTKAEVDAKIPSVTGFATQEWVNEQGFIKEHQDISGLATKIEIAAVEAKADTNTEAIATLNGNALVEGSVDYKVKNAQDALDAKIANVYTKAESDAKFLTEHQDISGKADAADVAANTAAIAIINGNEAQEGSVKKALADAKVYTDAQVAGKADSASVYTKSEIDNMGFLTQHQDISGKADKTALDAEVLRAQNAEDAIAADMTALTGRVTTAEGDIDALETDVAANKVIVSETESVKLTSSREATGTTVSADVKLSNTNGNIIKIDGNGLYADASLAYSKTTNTLTFTAGGNSQSFELSEHTLVNNGYYDSETREIVLSLTTAEGAKEVRIKVNDLIHTLSVNNGVNNPLVLAVQHTDEGDVLSASLNISTESHNLILTDNGTLYASNQAKDHTGLWNGVEMPLQQIIENLRAETDKVDDLDGDVADLKADMQQAKLDILTTQNSVETLSGRVDDNATAISENTGSINTLATQMNSLAARVETAMTEFDEVSRKVDSYETRVTTLEAAVTGLNADIATLRSQLDAYKATTDARLEAIEEIVNNLIDFGEEG